MLGVVDALARLQVLRKPSIQRELKAIRAVQEIHERREAQELIDIAQTLRRAGVK